MVTLHYDKANNGPARRCGCFDCLRRIGITDNRVQDCLGYMRDHADGRYTETNRNGDLDVKFVNT